MTGKSFVISMKDQLLHEKLKQAGVDLEKEKCIYKSEWSVA